MIILIFMDETPDPAFDAAVELPQPMADALRDVKRSRELEFLKKDYSMEMGCRQASCRALAHHDGHDWAQLIVTVGQGGPTADPQRRRPRCE